MVPGVHDPAEVGTLPRIVAKKVDKGLLHAREQLFLDCLVG